MAKKPTNWNLRFVHGYPGWFVPLLIQRGDVKTESQAVKLLAMVEAIVHGDLKGIRKGLAAGFDPNLIFNDEPLLELAISKRQIDSVRALIAGGADVKRCKYVGGDVDMLRVLIEHGVDPNHSVSDCTLLGGACTEGDEAMVALLLESGADINATSSLQLTKAKRINRCTPLMLAAGRGQVAVMKMLLSAGADLRRKDSAGRTAIDWAKMLRGKKSGQIVKLLENMGDAASG